MKKLTINIEYEIGEYVYICHDTEQQPYMITAYLVSGNTITYEISKGAETMYFRGYELQKEKNLIY